MSSSGDNKGDVDSFAIVMDEMMKSTKACAELLGISLAVNTLLEEVKHEGLALLNKQRTYVETAEQLYPTMRLERMTPYIGSYLLINSTYESVTEKTNAFYAKISDCEEKMLAQSKAMAGVTLKPLTVDLVVMMTAEDHRRKYQQLEEDKKKIVEIKASLENAKAEWESTKESVTGDLNRCIHGLNLLLQLGNYFKRMEEKKQPELLSKPKI